MKQNDLLEQIKESLVIFDVDTVKKLSLAAIKEGITAEKIIAIMSKGMTIVGEKYEAGEYFVPELILAGETMKEAIEVLDPYMTGEGGTKIGTAVIATVAGDIHDIGKNIFITLMTTAGFHVIDLGVDVKAEDVVSAVKTHQPDILGLSALLTTNLEQFPVIINLLKKEGIRNKVKVIVGGATVTEAFASEVGVDGYAKTAIQGVEICKEWADSA